MAKNTLRFYETVFITRADVAAHEVMGIIEELAALVKEAGGEVVTTEYWGLRMLAYPIKKNKRGHYAMLGFQLKGDSIGMVNDFYKRNYRNIIRNLIIQVRSVSANPSAMMQLPCSKELKAQAV